MRIQVRDDTGKPLGAIQIKVIDLDAKEVAKQKNPAWQRLLEKLILKFVHPTPSRPTKSKKKSKPAPPQVSTIEIKIILPRLSSFSPGKVKAQVGSWSRRGKRLALASSIIVLAALVALIFSLTNHKSAPIAEASGKPKLKLVRANPPYKTILPDGKSIDQLGGWVKIPRPGGQAAYVYYDLVANTPIRVSEQPLPQSFKADVAGSIAKLAENSNAGEKFSASGTTTYIENTTDQQQYVILSKDGLLILINSTSRISISDWVKYVGSLN